MLFIIPVGLIASLFRCMERPREPEYQVVPQGPQVVSVTHRSRQVVHHQQPLPPQQACQPRFQNQPRPAQYQPRPPQQPLPPQQPCQPHSQNQPPPQYQPHPPQYQPHPPRYQPHPQQQTATPTGNPTALAGQPTRRKMFQKRDKNGYTYMQST